MNIDGEWFNEYGSVAILTSDGKGGLTGTYESTVGDAKGTYALTGRYIPTEAAGAGIALGWAVSWHNQYQNAHSVTTWCGQLLDFFQRIPTTWLLGKETTPLELWESTVVGQDAFTRVRPTAEAVDERIRLGVAVSHPLRLLTPQAP
jgi:Avidin family